MESIARLDNLKRAGSADSRDRQVSTHGSLEADQHPTRRNAANQDVRALPAGLSVLNEHLDTVGTAKLAGPAIADPFVPIIGTNKLLGDSTNEEKITKTVKGELDERGAGVDPEGDTRHRGTGDSKAAAGANHTHSISFKHLPFESRQAAFLGLPYASFKEIAPGLPRRAITPARFGYLRRELLEHFAGPVRVKRRVDSPAKAPHSA